MNTGITEIFDTIDNVYKGYIYTPFHKSPNTQYIMEASYYLVIRAPKEYIVGVDSSLGKLYRLGYKLSFTDLKTDSLDPNDTTPYRDLYSQLFGTASDYVDSAGLDDIVNYLHDKLFTVSDIVIHVCDSHYIYLEEISTEDYKRLK